MDLCSICALKGCQSNDKTKMPVKCPSLVPEVADFAASYTGDTLAFATAAAKLEKEGYDKYTRIEETIQLILKMGYQKVGFAFCMGLKKEMEVLHKIFSGRGFEVHSVGCKCGSISKDILGPKEDFFIKPHKDFESLCNPIGQAIYLNKCGTEFNVMIGLCVGHDTLFLQNAAAPATVLAVKDRITGHNPLMPVYLVEGYYKRLLKK